jgi:hypothetical protein
MEVKLPLYKMIISDTDEGDEEVDWVALVQSPAIQRNFLAFNEEFAKTYDDYPEAARENAKIALRWAEENGWGSCGTPVGKKRANDLANGVAISRETIARMAAFERHRQNSKRELGDGCGRLMWLAWGGDAGVEWAQRKLDQIDREDMGEVFNKFSTLNEDEQIVVGPLMIADLPIYRRDENGEYYVIFTADEIKKIVQRFFKKGYQQKVNIEHDKPTSGVYMYESYIINRDLGVLPPKGYEDVADGSWFGTFKIDNPSVWEMVKDGTFKGFSVEGLFRYEMVDAKITHEELTMSKIINILNQIEH